MSAVNKERKKIHHLDTLALWRYSHPPPVARAADRGARTTSSSTATARARVVRSHFASEDAEVGSRRSQETSNNGIARDRNVAERRAARDDRPHRGSDAGVSFIRAFELKIVHGVG